MPPPFTELERIGARLRLQLSDGPMSILQFDTARRKSLEQQSSEPATIEATPSRPRWNVLVRKLAGGRSNPATALRPANLPSGSSVIDLFRLIAFHSLSNNRFATARRRRQGRRPIVEQLSARHCLPADIGLLLTDQYLVLDFSTRPFDPVELDRMISVAEQVSRRVDGSRSMIRATFLFISLFIATLALILLALGAFGTGTMSFPSADRQRSAFAGFRGGTVYFAWQSFLDGPTDATHTRT